MTTIAQRGTFIVGDSCCSMADEEDGDWYCYAMENKLRSTQHVAFGTSGDADCPDFMNMLAKLRSPDDLPCGKRLRKFDETSALFVFREQPQDTYCLEAGEMHHVQPGGYTAIGSGKKFALGAMALPGRIVSAWDATIAASRHCLHTRGPFWEFDSEKWRYTQRSGSPAVA